MNTPTIYMPATAVRCLLAAAALGAFGFACSDADVVVDNLVVSPESANKGESLAVEGQVSSLTSLESVDVSVRDEKDAPVPDSAGITISANAYPGDKIAWDLKKDGEVKVQTKSSTPSGTYKIRVEGKTAAKNGIDVKTFKVR